MPQYKFRANENTPQGALHPVDLEHRVLASLEDAKHAGIHAAFDWLTAEVGEDDKGVYVVLDVTWPEGTGFAAARSYIDKHFVTIE